VTTSYFILVCLGGLFCLLWLLRRDRVSLGLPIAYLYSLLLIHVPGALAHVFGRDFLLHSDLVDVAMRYTTLGVICFVLGCWWARSTAIHRVPMRTDVDRPRFWWFCFIGGLVLSFGISNLYDIPSFNALGDKGSAIWMLGVLLGLRNAFQRGDRKGIVIWICALMVFPLVILLFAGFLSYGSAAIIIVCAALTVSTRNYWRLVLGITVFTYISLSIFVNYYENRTELRKEVWGGAPLDVRVNTVVDTFTNLQLFDPYNRQHLVDLDDRLNQNYFVGLAARRIERGQVAYLKGESLWEGLLALVPRIFWPEKPVYGGSPQIVSKMTGLHFSSQTSIGVGNVMELQVNFGYPGIVVGFFVLGWAIGKLDLKAAIADRQGDLGTLILCFLPCVAMIQPNGSIVEITGGPAAALVAAYLWSRLWIKRFERQPIARNRLSAQLPVSPRTRTV
jgi:hypothetical protein